MIVRTWQDSSGVCSRLQRRSRSCTCLPACLPAGLQGSSVVPVAAPGHPHPLPHCRRSPICPPARRPAVLPHCFPPGSSVRELTLPIAKYLGVPKENVFANRMNWQWDDETGEPTQLMGFDMNEPTAHNQVQLCNRASAVPGPEATVLRLGPLPHSS